MAKGRTGQPIRHAHPKLGWRVGIDLPVAPFFSFAIVWFGFVLIWNLPTAARALQPTRPTKKDGND
jgi:hypothetical protein